MTPEENRAYLVAKARELAKFDKATGTRYAAETREALSTEEKNESDR